MHARLGFDKTSAETILASNIDGWLCGKCMQPAAGGSQDAHVPAPALTLFNLDTAPLPAAMIIDASCGTATIDMLRPQHPARLLARNMPDIRAKSD